MLPLNLILLTRGDAPRFARRLPLAIKFRAFGAAPHASYPTVQATLKTRQNFRLKRAARV